MTPLDLCLEKVEVGVALLHSITVLDHEGLPTLPSPTTRGKKNYAQLAAPDQTYHLPSSSIDSKKTGTRGGEMGRTGKSNPEQHKYTLEQNKLKRIIKKGIETLTDDERKSFDARVELQKTAKASLVLALKAKHTSPAWKYMYTDAWRADMDARRAQKIIRIDGSGAK